MLNDETEHQISTLMAPQAHLNVHVLPVYVRIQQFRQGSCFCYCCFFVLFFCSVFSFINIYHTGPKGPPRKAILERNPSQYF